MMHATDGKQVSTDLDQGQVNFALSGKANM